MLKFIVHITTMLSLGAILYIIARTLPRIEEKELKPKKALLRSHIILYYAEKIDNQLKFVRTKSLRRLSVILLKLENKINKKLENIKKETDKNGEIT